MTYFLGKCSQIISKGSHCTSLAALKRFELSEVFDILAFGFAGFAITTYYTYLTLLYYEVP